MAARRAVQSETGLPMQRLSLPLVRETRCEKITPGDSLDRFLPARSKFLVIARKSVSLLYTKRAMSCLFCKIVDGSIPSTAVYQDEQCYAFADLHPQAPVHILITPRKHIASLADSTEGDRALLGHLLWTAARIARDKGLANGYRVVVNAGEDGGQSVDHLHVHLLGGRPLTWPPG
jgi:histidine triad (HIT) family protein